MVDNLVDTQPLGTGSQWPNEGGPLLDSAINLGNVSSVSNGAFLRTYFNGLDCRINRNGHTKGNHNDISNFHLASRSASFVMQQGRIDVGQWNTGVTLSEFDMTSGGHARRTKQNIPRRRQTYQDPQHRQN